MLNHLFLKILQFVQDDIIIQNYHSERSEKSGFLHNKYLYYLFGMITLGAQRKLAKAILY